MSNEVVEKGPPPRYLGFIAGMFSGVMKNVVGHPFDTVKVRLQTSTGRFKGPMDCVFQTFQKEGVKGFYKGFTPPLVGWVMMDSVMLGSLHTYRRFILENFYQKEGKLDLKGHCLAGLGSGLTVSFVAAPVEHVKARLQVQYDNKQKLYSGPIDVLRKLYKLNGFKGVYPLLPLISTSIFRSNFIVWWGSYYLFDKWFSENTSWSKPVINFFSGGFSASCFWITAFPADVVKNVIMVDDPVNKKFPRYMDAVRHIYRTRGIPGFFKGFAPSFIRSFPANAAALAAFEAVMRVWH